MWTIYVVVLGHRALIKCSHGRKKLSVFFSRSPIRPRLDAPDDNRTGSSPELMIQMQESPLVFSTLRSVLSRLHSSPGEISEPLVAAGAMEVDLDDQEDELEFTFACTRQPYSSPVSADKIFLNGQIRPLNPFTFPARDEGITEESHFPQKRSPAVLREPLRRLFSRDREWNSYSCPGSRSHEEAELDGIDPGMYCLWRPRAGAALEGKRASNKKKKKEEEEENSEESGTVSVSKRWKVKDLVYSHGGKRVSDEPLE